jgi:hypothetical protein
MTGWWRAAPTTPGGAPNVLGQTLAPVPSVRPYDGMTTDRPACALLAGIPQIHAQVLGGDGIPMGDEIGGCALDADRAPSWPGPDRHRDVVGAAFAVDRQT